MRDAGPPTSVLRPEPQWQMMIYGIGIKMVRVIRPVRAAK